MSCLELQRRGPHRHAQVGRILATDRDRAVLGPEAEPLEGDRPATRGERERERALTVCLRLAVQFRHAHAHGGERAAILLDDDPADDARALEALGGEGSGRGDHRDEQCRRRDGAGDDDAK